MFTVELKVNGVLCSHLYGHNTYPGAINEKMRCRYSISHYRVRDGSTVSFTVQHDQKDGLDILIEKALSKANKLRSK